MKKVVLLTAAAILVFAGCTKTESLTGRLTVKVTDDPFPINRVESATVTIAKIEIRKAGIDETDGNPFLVLCEDTLTFDLINLRNGLTETILDLEIPDGTYDLVRICIEEAAMKLVDHPSPFSVKVPSGRQTGIKIFINPSLTVEGGLTSELLLDFDLSKSFVMRGNINNHKESKGFIFKPCIRAVNNTRAGRITGIVTDTSLVKIVNANVWIAQDSIIATAFTDTLGSYAIIGVPAGTYSIFATKDGYDTVSFTGLRVIAGNRTVQNFKLTEK